MNETTISVDPSCMDDFDPQALLADQAQTLILRDLHPVAGHEMLPIRSALDRVLASDVASNLMVPGHTNSAMDGYALHHSDLPASGSTMLSVVGTALAGKPFKARVNTGECVRIMTGAAMPENTDTVVMQEHAQAAGSRIRIDQRHRAGQNVRMAGEDIQIDQRVLAAGRRLTAADIGLMASLGLSEVRVRRRPRVAFFSTGDELRGVGERLQPGDVYDSNRYTLYCMLARLNVEPIDLGVIPDRLQATVEAFERAAEQADVVITSGGVSVGEADFVKQALDQLGEVAFWKVAMKPGRPLAFGSVGKARFFGLPGNPVSVMVTFYMFVQPAIRRLRGESETTPLLLDARSRDKLRKKAGRTEYQRGVLSQDSDGALAVGKTGQQGSGILTSMSTANCFIVLPLEAESIDPGATVKVIPFTEII